MAWFRALSASTIIGLTGAGAVSGAAQQHHAPVHGVIERAHLGKKGAETITVKVHQHAAGSAAASGSTHETTFHVAAHTKVMKAEHANGKTTHVPAKIEDLKAGEHVTVVRDATHQHIAAAVMIGHHGQKTKQRPRQLASRDEQIRRGSFALCLEQLGPPHFGELWPRIFR
jgi:hypothetical protein